MSEKTEITFMQTRLIRLASEEWHLPVEQIIHLFKEALKDGFVLYHGSYCEVKEPDLAKCAKRKDFGQGFYLTTSKEQAESFLRSESNQRISFSVKQRGWQNLLWYWQNSSTLVTRYA